MIVFLIRYTFKNVLSLLISWKKNIYKKPINYINELVYNIDAHLKIEQISLVVGQSK